MTTNGLGTLSFSLRKTTVIYEMGHFIVVSRVVTVATRMGFPQVFRILIILTTVQIYVFFGENCVENLIVIKFSPFVGIACKFVSSSTWYF